MKLSLKLFIIQQMYHLLDVVYTRRQKPMRLAQEYIEYRNSIVITLGLRVRTKDHSYIE